MFDSNTRPIQYEFPSLPIHAYIPSIVQYNRVEGI